MYNVGFGDAFLILIPDDPRPRRVLIDCGSIKDGSAGGVNEVAERIIRDVTDDDGVARIDIVAMSHFHQDHISGFADRSMWRDVEVGEVWMPWTEDPDDPQAHQLKQRQLALAAAVQDMADQARLMGQADDEVEFLADEADNVFSAMNADAKDTLLNGFAGDPARRFLRRDSKPRRPRALPKGVRVHVLGPSTNPDVINRMDPPSKESFMRLSASNGGSNDGDLPFHEWEMTPSDFMSAYSGTDIADIQERLAELGREGGLLAASILSSSVNNTSLVLAFEYGEAVLLFPGDAQWGTWELILASDHNRRLLGRTSFYKIGHHGSHNATPVSLVNACLPPGVWSTASVRKRGSWDIPRAELLEGLEQIAPGRVFRSDEPPSGPGDGVTVDGDRSIEISVATVV
jgi:beta-lactamase superfamily II metal-dependent hydrolase